MTATVAFLSLTHRFDDTRILAKEAFALVQAGYHVTHLAPDHGTPAPREVDGVTILLYAPRHASRLRRGWRLWRSAWTLRADVLHANEPESWLVALVVKLFRPATRVVFDVHEHYPSRFSEGRFPRWATWIGGPALKAAYRLLTPFTDHVIFAKRSVVPDFRVTDGRGTLIFNYAPLRIAVPSRDDTPVSVRALFPGAPTAVHIGGFSRQRGWPQLLEALARTEDCTIRVVAIGEVVEGVETLRQEAERLGVGHRVTILERVPYQQLFHYLVAADVGLMLYQPGILNHVYAFPMKLYDYMLAGLPVIGPAFAPEVTPVVSNERIGWLIDTADPDALAHALDAVARDRTSARAMGIRGQEAVRRTYNWEREAKKLVAVYAELTASGTNRVSNVADPDVRALSTSAEDGSARP